MMSRCKAAVRLTRPAEVIGYEDVKRGLDFASTKMTRSIGMRRGT